MKKRMAAFMLSGILVVGTMVPVMAANDKIQIPVTVEHTKTVVEVPDSVLYYGEIKKIEKNKENEIVRLLMDSERYGEIIMNLSEETVWIDTGNKRASNPADLKEGERVYIYHSLAMTRSLPAQTTAFAVVRNIPEDVGIAKYHVIDAIEKQKNGTVKITVDNGSKVIWTKKKTTIAPYKTKNKVTINQLKEGDRLMVWYSNIMPAIYPQKQYVDHMMLLPR